MHSNSNLMDEKVRRIGGIHVTAVPFKTIKRTIVVFDVEFIE